MDVRTECEQFSPVQYVEITHLALASWAAAPQEEYSPMAEDATGLCWQIVVWKPGHLQLVHEVWSFIVP